MIELTTLTIQFINNIPDGIRICHGEGESLVTVVVPRDLLAEAKQLPDIPKRGIYYLLNEEHGVIKRVYAGQTTQGLKRLDSHKFKKDFWNKAVMFLDDEVNIDRDVLDALEAHAIGYVTTHGSYETDNSDTPQPYVSPYKEQTVERLHQKILFRMTALGYNLDRTEPAVPKRDDATLFHTKRNGVVAHGRYDASSGSFTVLAGSQVCLSRAVIKNGGAQDMRLKLFGTSTADAVLGENATFASPSAAAVFVLGGSANGWVEWVDSQGQTLDSVYREKKD